MNLLHGVLVSKNAVFLSHIVAARLQPVARLSSDEYTTLGRIFVMKRPE